MMAKSSTRNQRRRQEYNALAERANAGQQVKAKAQSTHGDNGLEATLNAVRAVAPRRPQKQRQMTNSPHHASSPPKPSSAAQRLLKELPAPVSTKPPTSVPSPMALAKPHQLQAVRDDRPRCAIPRCKERDNICSPAKVLDCLEQRAYREALDRFIS